MVIVFGLLEGELYCGRFWGEKLPRPAAYGFPEDCVQKIEMFMIFLDDWLKVWKKCFTGRNTPIYIFCSTCQYFSVLLASPVRTQCNSNHFVYITSFFKCLKNIKLFQHYLFLLKNLLFPWKKSPDTTGRVTVIKSLNYKKKSWSYFYRPVFFVTLTLNLPYFWVEKVSK